MCRELTFTRNVGNFKAGEKHCIKNDVTASYFVNNSFATEEVDDKGCGCNDVENAAEQPVEASTTEKAKKEKTPKADK